MRRRRSEGGSLRRGRWALAGLALVGLVAAALVVAAVISRTPEEGRPTASDGSSTASPSASLGGLDVSNLPIARSPFCGLLDDAAVQEALGGPVDSARDWSDGDQVRLEDGLVDVAHEFGCAFAGGGAEARAWVFAAPVPPATALALTRQAQREAGCVAAAAAPVFGRPGTTMVCRRGTGPAAAVEVTSRGLFGDAWLTCRLTAPRTPGEPAAAVADRAEQWCVHVVTTLGARD